MKNTTNKKNMNTIKVNLTNCTAPFDVTAAFVDAKVDNKIPIEEWELKTYCEQNYNAGFRDGIDSITDALSAIFIIDKEHISNIVDELKPKKPNIFKRFWNWITRKK